MQQDTVIVPTLDYAQVPRRGFSVLLNLIGFLLTPFVVALGYVLFSRWPVDLSTMRSDYVFVGIACVSCAFCAAKLPLPLWLRLLLLMGYSAALNFVMDTVFLYAVGFIHGNWL